VFRGGVIRKKKGAPRKENSLKRRLARKLKNTYVRWVWTRTKNRTFQREKTDQGHAEEIQSRE